MKTFLALASMLVFAGAVATANSHPDVVKSRQSDMKAMAELSKALNDYFLGKRPYNPTKFKAAANAIRKDAAGLTAHFSDIIEAPGSSASPFIKVDRIKFEELARHLEQYAAQVSAAAQNGQEIPAAMRMNPREMTEGGPFAKKTKLAAVVSAYSSEHAFHMMLQTCTACHAKFRMKGN